MTRTEGVRTYKRRAGRMTQTQEDALARLWTRFGLDVDGAPLDLPALFGRVAPVVLEIGFGMGEATLELAATQPGRDVLAVDVHMPGHAALISGLDTGGLTNVRAVDGDARLLLAEMLGPQSLTEVRIFFPDPWPKNRHAKRRLLTPRLADLLADRLVDGGTLHIATDIAAYAQLGHDVIADHPALQVRSDVPWRPRTKFEQRGLAAGRDPHDLVAVRIPRPAAAAR